MYKCVSVFPPVSFSCSNRLLADFSLVVLASLRLDYCFDPFGKGKLILFTLMIFEFHELCKFMGFSVRRMGFS